ncbi:MAG: hypothetical protein AAF636_12175 [Pseudomonadota bacterium]
MFFKRPCHLVFLAAAVLTGCAPLRIYHQPGVPVATMQRTLLDCQVSALEAAPVANQIRQEPPRYIPGNRYCDGAGNCYRRGGYWIDGRTYTVDRNADLRTRVERQCMADQNYSFSEIPRCSAAVKTAAPPDKTTVLPPIGPQSCAIRYDDGSYQIVDVAP